MHATKKRKKERKETKKERKEERKKERDQSIFSFFFGIDRSIQAGPSSRVHKTKITNPKAELTISIIGAGVDNYDLISSGINLYERTSGCASSDRMTLTASDTVIPHQSKKNGNIYFLSSRNILLPGSSSSCLR